MSGNYKSFWNELVRKNQRVEKTPTTAADVEKLIESVEAEPLSDDEIGSIVQAVSRGESHTYQPEPSFDWIDNVDTSSIEEGMLQINRNQGDADSDVEKRMDDFRKKALEDDGDDKEDVESD